MFGILRGASCTMKPDQRQAWMGHICGVCLALRDQAGQLSRVATNYDAALISVLCEAQTPTAPTRYTSHCPLRSQFKLDITAPSSEAAQYAASVALVMASTKVQDHLADQETWLRHLPYLAGQMAQRWGRQGRSLAAQFGFASEAIETQVQQQVSIEACSTHDFFAYTRPTELAVAAAFQHTSVIAQAPQNADPLYQMGRMFGRIMLLLDSYEDYAADIAANKFNALAACSL